MYLNPGQICEVRYFKDPSLASFAYSASLINFRRPLKQSDNKYLFAAIDMQRALTRELVKSHNTLSRQWGIGTASWRVSIWQEVYICMYSPEPYPELYFLLLHADYYTDREKPRLKEPNQARL